MKEINTVILDIGKVLVEFDWMSYVNSMGFSDDIAKEVGNYIFNNKLWKERDRGDKKEEEYIELYIQGASHLEKEIRKVFENIVDIVEVYPFSKAFVKSLKENGKKVYLLSNYSKKSFENDKKKFAFLPYIDGGVISYQINHVKPEREIYDEIIKKYNINPGEAVFLDDVEENLDGAREVGLQTIHVTSHDAAIKGLAEFGIVVN